MQPMPTNRRAGRSAAGAYFAKKHFLAHACRQVVARTCACRTLRLARVPRTELAYSMDGPVGFLRFGEGTLATYGPGSSRIVKFQWNLKVLRPK